MRAAALFLLSALLVSLSLPVNNMLAQQKAAKQKVELKKDEKDPPKKEEPKKDEPKKDDGSEQKKADLETLKLAGLADETKALTDFFRNHTVTEADKVRLLALIKKLGDDDFDTRQAASAELSKAGVGVIALLRTAQKDGDAEIVRRCDLALKIIEKVPTRTVGMAAARRR